jgi:adenosine deaminase
VIGPRDLARLPKAHLHLHFDGALRRETFEELAASAGCPAPMPTSYGSFADFERTIAIVATVLRTRADIARVAHEIAQDAVRDGAVWLELSVWPGLFKGRFGSDADALDVLLEAVAAASKRCKVGIGVIVAANRDRGPAEACTVAHMAAARSGSGVVGLGLDGDEAMYPAAFFVEAFATAAKAGLASLPHAGELAGAESVADAIDLLGARRVLHGVRAIEDSGLVRRLAESGVCLDICPTSNVLLSVVDSIERHPLPALLAAGVSCSVNADDPLLFDTTLVGEYERCRSDLGLSDVQLATIACTSLQASCAPKTTVQRAYAAIEQWLTRW